MALLGVWAALASPPVFDLPFGGRAGWGFEVTQSFAAGSPTHQHAGVDLAAPCGTPVRAMADGEIVAAEARDPKGRGARRIILAHAGTEADRIYTEYAHLSRLLKTTGRVARGEVIGWSGTSTGRGCHLHVSARRGRLPTGGYTSGPPGQAGYLDPQSLVR